EAMAVLAVDPADLPACGQVPQGEVLPSPSAPYGDGLAVGRQRDGVFALVADTQPPQFLPGGCVPHRDLAVAAATDQDAAVTGKLDGVVGDPLLHVALEAA